MTRRLVHIFTIGLITLAAGFCVLLAGINSGPGKAGLAHILEPELENALGYDVEIIGLGGFLPFRIRADEISIADVDGVWLSVEDTKIAWHPSALIRNQVEIDHLHIEKIALNRLGGERRDFNHENRFFPALNAIPVLKIGDISIPNIESRIDGKPIIGSLTGSFYLDQFKTSGKINLESDAATEDVSLNFDLRPAENILIANGDVELPTDGLIGTILSLDNAIAANFKTRSTGDAATITAAIHIENAVRLSANLSTDASADLFLSIDGVATPASGSLAAENSAGPIAIKAAITERANGRGFDAQYDLLMERMEITGTAYLETKSDRFDDLRMSGEVSLDAEHYAQVAPLIGSKLGFDFGLARFGERFLIDGKIANERLQITLEETKTDLVRDVNGIAEIELPDGFAPFSLENPVAARTHFKYTADQILTLRRLSLISVDELQVSGQTTIKLAQNEFTASADGSLAPALLSRLQQTLEPDNTVDMSFNAEGQFSSFSLDAQYRLPAGTMNGATLPAINGSASFAALPDYPNGQVQARALDGSLVFSGDIRTSRSKVMSISNGNYSGDNFALAFSGEFDQTVNKGRVSAQYQGSDGAHPFPGMRVEGDVAVEATTIGTMPKFSVTAENLLINELRTRELSVALDSDGETGQFLTTVKQITFADNSALSDVVAAADVSFASAISGVISKLETTIEDGRLRLSEPARFEVRNGVTLDNFNLDWSNGGTMTLNALFSPTRWQGEVSIRSVDIPQTDAQFNAEATFDTDQPMIGEGSIDYISLLEDKSDTPITFNIEWREDLVSAQSVAGSPLELDLRIPIKKHGGDQLSFERDGAISAVGRINGPVTVFAALLPPDAQSVEGDLSGTFTLRFDDELEMNGDLNVTNGAFTEPNSGFSVTGVRANAAINQNDINEVEIKLTGAGRGAQRGSDTIRFDGSATLDDALKGDLQISLDNAVFIAQPINKARMNGDINVQFAEDTLSVSGDINVGEVDAEIIVPEISSITPITIAYTDEADLNAELARGPDIDLALRITANDRIFIRGRGMETEWRADIVAETHLDQPVLTGDLTLRRGSLDFADRRFNISNGVVKFDRLSPNDPVLTIRAENTTETGVVAVIDITGRASAPTISLSSTPVLPDEDVMALILFGEPANDLSAFETLQVATALASLGGVGPFAGGGGINGTLRRATGLDLINVDPDTQNGAVALTVGKYVAKDVFVSATQDSNGQTGAVRVQYDVSDNISLETEIEQDGDQTLSANWKHDF